MTEPQPKGTILIVDNEPDNIHVLVTTLHHDYQLLEATSGEEALRIVTTAPKLDLILLDVMMPGLDGYEVCRRLKSQPQYEAIPIIFITSLSTDEEEIKGLEVGAADYITKPFSPKKVRARIKIQFDLMRSHDLLAKSMLKSELILESAGEGIFGIDDQGLTVFVNPSALRMTGYQREDLLGTTTHLLCQHTKADHTLDPTEECPINQTIHDGQVRHRSNEIFWRKDGSSFPVEYTVTPAPPSESTLRAVVVFTDITLRLQLEEEAVKAQKLTAISLLAGGIAHDFNNLLTVVIGYIELCRVSAASEDTAHLLDLAKDSSFKAAALARKLISFSEGGYPMKSKLDFQQLLHACSEKIIRPPYENQIIIADDLWAVFADEQQIHQVVENLYLNAIEAMPNGGLIETTLANCLSEGLPGDGLAGPNSIQLTITDHGHGISAEVMPKIFDPYFSTKSRGAVKGMGFGLSICLAIVKRHLGLLKVVSEPGRGTVVTVTLPATTSAAEAA